MVKLIAFVLVTSTLLVAVVEALSTPFGQVGRNVATQILQGTGQVQVDLNQYNLESVEEVCKEWTANLVQKTGEKDVGVKLGVKSKDLFVDTVRVSFERSSSGLGIELSELAGGREDGLGITVVTGLVKGGASDGLDIIAGDVLSKVSVIRKRRMDVGTSVADTEEEFVARTECLGYDATVDAILSLPQPASDLYEESFIVSLKRIRRKPKVTVKLQYPPSQKEKDETLQLFAGENLRLGMLIRGVKLNDPLAKRFDTKNGGNCGAGGLCRTCAVSVLQGKELLNPQRPAEQQMLQDSPRWRLACKAIVGYGMQQGEMTIRVNPRQWD